MKLCLWNFTPMSENFVLVLPVLLVTNTMPEILKCVRFFHIINEKSHDGIAARAPSELINYLFDETRCFLGKKLIYHLFKSRRKGGGVP